MSRKKWSEETQIVITMSRIKLDPSRDSLSGTNLSSTRISNRPQPVRHSSFKRHQTLTITIMSSGQTTLSNILLSSWKRGSCCIQDVLHLFTIKYYGQDHGLGDSPWTTPALLVSIVPKLRFLLSNRLSLYSYAAALIVALMLLYSALSRTAVQCRSGSGQETYSHIHVLTKFMVPTRSIWPPSYFIARSWMDARCRTANLSVEALFQDIIQGRMELRKPVHNLPLIIMEQLRLDGWRLGLSVGLDNRAKMLFRTFWEKGLFSGDVRG